MNIDLMVVILLEAIALEAVLGLLFPMVRDRMPPLGGVPNLFFLPIVKKLNRSGRSDGVLMKRSLFLLILAISLAVSSGYWLAIVLRHIPYGSLVEVVVIFSCLSWTRPWRRIPQLIEHVRQNDREAVNRSLLLMSRAQFFNIHFLKKSDIHTVARVATEDMAIRFSRGLVAPSLWYIVFSFTGFDDFRLTALFTYVVVADLRRIVQQVNPRTGFERPIGFLDEVLHYVPSRFATVIIWLAALFSPSANILRSMRCVVDKGMLVSSSATGWLLSSFAGALNIVLAGNYPEIKWVGPENASAKADSKALKKAFWLYNIAAIIFIGLLVALLYNALGQFF